MLDALGDRNAATGARARPRERTGARSGRSPRRCPSAGPPCRRHLRVLEGAGLVTCTKRGTRHLYAVQPDGLAVLRLWLDGFWDDALIRFKAAAEGSE